MPTWLQRRLADDGYLVHRAWSIRSPWRPAPPCRGARRRLAGARTRRWTVSADVTRKCAEGRSGVNAVYRNIESTGRLPSRARARSRCRPDRTHHAASRPARGQSRSPVVPRARAHRHPPIRNDVTSRSPDQSCTSSTPSRLPIELGGLAVRWSPRRHRLPAPTPGRCR